jgi:hypothetical protein
MAEQPLPTAASAVKSPLRNLRVAHLRIAMARRGISGNPVVVKCNRRLKIQLKLRHKVEKDRQPLSD